MIVTHHDIQFLITLKPYIALIYYYHILCMQP